jgi:FkbM family methyltransferase
MSLWAKWKLWWRRFENAPFVRTAKRRVRQLTGNELRHFVEVRCPTARYGGWTISTVGLEPGGIAYSLGVGEDATLDSTLVDRFGLEVHAFDPTPRAMAWVRDGQLPEGVRFHPIGVAGYDGTAEFVPSSNPVNPSFTLQKRGVAASEGVACEVRRLSTLARVLGHGRIDLLKMDIEGAEYDVIDDMLESGIEVRQIVVEFHHRFRHVGRARTARTVRSLREAGFRIFSISPSGREYSFMRVGDVTGFGEGGAR